MTLRYFPPDMQSDDSALLQYESLRSQAVHRQAWFAERSLGLALFIRQGMLAWIEVCHRYMPTPPSREKRADPPVFAFAATSEMIKVMANITLFNLEEALL